MTPHRRIAHIRRIALRLAKAGALSAHALAAAIQVERYQASKWIARLDAEGAVRCIGYDDAQLMGRPRKIYGLTETGMRAVE